jgi:hypothetical protein
MQRLKLCLPADKAAEPASHRCLQAPADGADSDQFKDLHRIIHALHRHWPQGVHLHQALHQP